MKTTDTCQTVDYVAETFKNDLEKSKYIINYA